MAQVKYEPFDDDIDDIDSIMRDLIDRTDWYLNSLRNRPSNNSSSANESNASSSRESSRTSSNAQPEQAFGIQSVMSQHQNERNNDSSGSDTTILCSTDVVLPEASTPIPVVDNSFGQDVIVLGTPATETRVRRIARRNARRNERSLNVDTSVIDLSNYQEPESVVIISSDEEDNATLPNTVRSSLPLPRQPQPQPRPSGHSWSTIIDHGYAVSVHTAPTQSISISLSSGNNAHPGRVSIQSSTIDNHRHRDVVLVNTIEPMPAPIAALPVQPAPPPRPVAQPPPRPVAPPPPYRPVAPPPPYRPVAPPPRYRPVAPPAPAPKTNLDKKDTSQGVKIICPICFETLANRPAVSTSCGHVFCAECLQQAKKNANRCPICKRLFTRTNKTHPLFFATE